MKAQKFLFSTVQFGVILFVGGIAGASSTFTAHGSTNVTSPSEEARDAMTAAAQTQCSGGLVAVQMSPTEFKLVPHSYPTEKIATATFTCQSTSESSPPQSESQITGIARTQGTRLQDCRSLAKPSRTEAELNADENAASFCSSLPRTFKAVRSSDFSYFENDCVWGGLRYEFPANTLIASAVYRCL